MSLDWLKDELTSTAYAWRLERADGVAIGFVSHDRDVVVDNFLYRASPGMIPSTIALSDSLEIDNVEIEGVMTDAAIAEADLISGRWNGAKLSISLINWEHPEYEARHLITGEFGEIVRSDDAFRAEMLGRTSFLDDAIAPLTSPTCRARFGDRKCKLSLNVFQIELPVTAIADDNIEFAGLQGQGADFGFGELRWLGGNNCGLCFGVLKGAGNDILLTDQPFDAVAIGDRALLTEGCDKNFSTCRDRFSNSLNFRGEPYLPGNDLLTRYPGS